MEKMLVFSFLPFFDSGVKPNFPLPFYNSFDLSIIALRLIVLDFIIFWDQHKYFMLERLNKEEPQIVEK